MGRKIAFWLLWIGFATYALVLAPPDQPDTLQLIQHLSTGEWQGLNPLVIALFNIMGIWPLIYSCVLLMDGRTQAVPAWPFVLGSFAVGAFAVIPYLALRTPGGSFSGAKSSLLKLLDARWTGVILTVGTLMLLGYGLHGGELG
ncbi:hypothetical protein [Neosynechococcus sphagnicola]|uniref:hypothetical protein n=1 Tax=Neosynechococcus sphagnicola TaxID=1501145 RepID=UPI000A79E15C|nr:hypothetical protein [Neosynechococcus sphagnicola]